MPTNKIDFHNAECSACYKKSIDIRTEVLMKTEKNRLENRITKKIIFRCLDHINSNVDDMEELALKKTTMANVQK